MDLSPLQALAQMDAQGLSKVFATDPRAKDFVVKQVVAGIFITTRLWSWPSRR